MKFKTKEIMHKGKQVVFVTRGRSKPFTHEECEEYLQCKVDELELTPVSNAVKVGIEQAKRNDFVKAPWTGVGNERHHKTIFIHDIRMGLKFCAEKYATSELNIIAEAQRLGLQAGWE